jgi:hypothetical protein
MNEVEKKWTEYAKKYLVGRTITKVHYLSEDECDEMDWRKRPLLIVLDNGTMLFPSQDDEGNDGGALFGQAGKVELTFPVL